MTISRYLQYTSPIVLSAFLVACGEGASTSSISVPTTGAATGTSNANVSGRVADGYIQGATVCIDLNENDACDEGEPSAVTGEGGVYDLTIPPGGEDKPIVADIPATAIDEDTGEPVGKPLVFIAPADKPEFVSPITTLVQQELRENPALELDDAEKAVKTILGIDEAEISLFDDYVEKGDDESGDSETVEKFKYLHDTARVVASIMKDIETQVETAAVSRGVDVTGDTETKRAIRDIVRTEVRDLLPDIARQVAEIVTSVTVQEGTATQPQAFDPDALAVQLRPTDAIENVDSRIQAVKERTEVAQGDIKQILTDGVYWMEFDCHFEHGDSSEYEPNPDGTVMITDEEYSYPTPVCEAMYGHVQLNDAGDTISSDEYLFDPASGTWQVDNLEEDYVADYSLVNGEWVAVYDDGPNGNIQFNDDGSAVLTNDRGVMELKAVTQTMDGAPVGNHLWEDGADPIWFELIGPEDLFTSGAVAHRISVRESYHPYILFNHQPRNESEEAYCADYNGNCNVVNQFVDGQHSVLSYLDTVIEGTLQGIEIATHGVGEGEEVLMKLSAEPTTDGSLPTSGLVQWDLDFDPYYREYEYQPGVDSEYEYGKNGETYPAGGEYPAECQMPEYLPGEYPETEVPLPYEPGEIDEETLREFSELPERLPSEQDTQQFDENTGLDTVDYSEKDYEEYLQHLNCQPYPITEEYVDNIAPDGTTLRDESGESATSRIGLFESEWKLTEVQGVRMIEIKLPLVLKYEDDEESEREEAILLIEQNSYVRMGAKLADVYIDRVFTYNETAFTTLKSIVETGYSDIAD